MAKAKGLTITKKETSQTFNLKELFGQDVPFKIAKEFGERIEDLMIERTLKGKDIRGNAFAPYSKEYAKEKGSTEVDMTLTGDMLGEMSNTAKRDGTVKVQINGSTNKLKSFNHNVGDTLKQREFFGVKVTDPAVKEIVKDLKGGIKKEAPKKEVGDFLERVTQLDLVEEIESGSLSQLFTGEFFE